MLGACHWYSSLSNELAFGMSRLAFKKMLKTDFGVSLDLLVLLSNLSSLDNPLLLSTMREPERGRERYPLPSPTCYTRMYL